MRTADQLLDRCQNRSDVHLAIPPRDRWNRYFSPSLADQGTKSTRSNLLKRCATLCLLALFVPFACLHNVQRGARRVEVVHTYTTLCALHCIGFLHSSTRLFALYNKLVIKRLLLLHSQISLSFWAYTLFRTTNSRSQSFIPNYYSTSPTTITINDF